MCFYGQVKKTPRNIVVVVKVTGIILVQIIRCGSNRDIAEVVDIVGCVVLIEEVNANGKGGNWQ